MKLLLILVKSAYNNSGNIMPKRFGCISNTIEINLCEDFTGKKFCSPFQNKIFQKIDFYLKGQNQNFLKKNFTLQAA